ncbi:MAG: glycosyltransferase [Hyphomicrobiaceae bacterium]
MAETQVVAGSQGPGVRIAAIQRPGTVGTALRRVAVVAGGGQQLWRLRGGLIGAMRANRHGVTCFAPGYSVDSAMGLDGLGVERRILAPEVPGFHFFGERRRVNALEQEFEALRPHVVLAVCGEDGLRAVKAAKRARVEQVVALVSEVPAKGMNEALLKAAAKTLERADLAVFHNAEDPKTLKSRGMLPADLPYVIVPGAGVDLAFHQVQPLPPVSAGLVFLMISRLDRVKGVLDFCDAARIVKARAPSARFRLVGPPSDGASGLNVEAVRAFSDCVEYLGALDDVRPALGGCHVYVCPSHAEGMPRSVLEAMAAGRPVIASNIAGCRDTVDERINGCLVMPSDPTALAAAMESFLKRPDLIPSIARASRAKAERRFDERDVHATLLGVMGLG